MALHELTVAQAAKVLRDGSLSCLEYVDVLLARAEANSALNPFIHLDASAVRVAARAADEARARGHADGALHGVPLAVKDNLDTAGMATTGGTPGLRANVPARNAAVVQSLLDAGAIVFGKANLHELAFGITTNNAAFGPSRNPYDPTRIPGGSSGGTAVAVSARIVPGGIGTDTGGSVRVPSALCGLVGLRPTLSSWSREGVIPISWTRDTPGPMARSVEDCALLHGVVTGAPTTVEPVALRGLRLGVPRAHFWEQLHPEVAAAGERVLLTLREAGVVLVEADVEEVAQLDAIAGFPIALYESVIALDRYLRQHALTFGFRELADRCGSPDVRGLLMSLAGNGAVPRDAYVAAINTYRPKLQRSYRRYFADHRVDAALFPTTPLPAAAIGEDATVELLGKQVPTFPTFIRNCGPASVAGIPGLTLPIGLSSTGLPLGLELDAAFGHDLELLSIGAAIEALLAPMPAPKL